MIDYSLILDRLSPSDDLCASDDIRSEVKDLYYRYQASCNAFIPRLPANTTGPRKYYVYAWFAKTAPKKYFYVGKGAGDRYSHIKTEMEEGIKRKTSESRLRRYKMLSDSYGIDYEIMLDGLTDYESCIYEECLKLDMLEKGEYLLCYEGMPHAKKTNIGPEDIAINSPILEWDGFHERYYNIAEKPFFDRVSSNDLLSSSFHQAGVLSKNYSADIDKMKACIMNYISSNKGYSYTSPTAKTKSIIVIGYLCEDLYMRYRNEGKKVFGITEVYDYLAKNNLITSTSPTSFQKNELAIKLAIKNKLLKHGATEEMIFFEPLLVGVGNSCIRFFLYKKRPQCRLEIPLDIATFLDKKLGIKLTGYTKFKADYIFDIDDKKALDRIEPFFPTFIASERVSELMHAAIADRIYRSSTKAQ